MYVEVTVKNCKSVYNYSTVLGAAIKCKPYSETTVESRTHLKTVKITLNIFAVHNNKISKKEGVTFMKNIRSSQKCRPSPFILSLSQFYPDSVLILS